MARRYQTRVYCAHCHDLIERRRELVVATNKIFEMDTFHGACFAEVRERERNSERRYQVLNGEEGLRYARNACITGAIIGVAWVIILALQETSRPPRRFGTGVSFQLSTLTPYVIVILGICANMAFRVRRAWKRFRHLPK